MEIERKNAEKPLKRLRKALKSLPGDPSAKNVHELRTQTRRLEAISDALMLEHKRPTRRLLKTVTPVRKVAGSVRDMDVLVGNVLAMAQDRKDESLIRLIEHLGEQRVEGARDLRRSVAKRGKDAQRSLKSYTRLVEKQFPGKSKMKTTSATAPVALATEIEEWPTLTATNIHPFRIKVKQLRYMLQLSGGGDKELVDALGKVKDEVGDWHDWQELARIARQVLDAKSDGGALKTIEETGKRKFQQALKAANDLREQYFHSAKAKARIAGRNSKAKSNKK